MSSSSTYASDVNQLVSLIGPPGTPVHRVKGKAKRRELLGYAPLAKEAHIAVRLALALGKSSAREHLKPDILAEALVPFDIVANLDRLSEKQQLVSASAALKAFQTSADNLTPPLSWRAIVRLGRAIAKWRTSAIDGGTTAALISVLKVLVLRLRGEHKPARKREPFFRLFIQVLEFSANEQECSQDVLQLIGYSVDHFGAESEHFLEETPTHHSTFLKILGNFHALLLEYCTRGDVLALETSIRGLLRNKFIGPLAKAEAENLWSEHEKFSLEVQKTLAILTDRDTAYVDPLAGISGDPHSLAELQLASVLVSAWESAQKKGNQDESLFEQLRATLKNHFGLELFGVVGSQVEFNSRLHELSAPIAGQGPPRLIRPGVKVESGAGSRILLKALVE